MVNIKILDEINKKNIMNKIHILLVTAVEIEKETLNSNLIPIEGENDILQYNTQDNEYFIGKLGNYNVVHVQSNIGSIGEGASTITIRNALDIWNIKMVIMVGIAFGKGKEYNQKIGDVLISKNIFMYEKRKIKEKNGVIKSTFLDSPYANAGKILVKKFKDDSGWDFKLSNGKKPRIEFGTILSGEKLIDSKEEKNKILEQANLTYVVGGEMEAAGMVSACNNAKIDEWIVVKAISDWADGNKLENQSQNQKDAISAAISYTKYVFSKEKIFEEILNTTPLTFLKQVYENYPVNDLKRIDIVNNDEISLTPINPISKKVIKRQKIINRLKEEMNSGNHVNIFGEIFSGKTTILKILASEYGDNIKYIDLKNTDAAKIEEILLIISQIIIEVDSKEKLIIAIDNIPKLRKDSKIKDILEDMLFKATNKEIKIILTSLNSQQNILEDSIDNLVYINVEEIEKNDVLELLNLYSAPDYMLKDRIIEFIEVIGKHKIYIIKLIIKYLKDENWDILKNGLIGIIDEKYVLKIKGEIQDLILSIVKKDNQKELLYRMGSINSDLTIEEIKRICEVNPKINNPIEILRENEGSFIEYDNENNTYRTNPLIAQISKENLSNETFIEINKVLANCIMEKKTLNPYEIIRCIGFFNQAKEYDEAGILYFQTISEMYEKNIKDEWGIKSIWKDLELPNMSSDLKLRIRIAQLRYYIKFGIRYKETLDLTIKLIEEEEYEDFYIAGIAILFINENYYEFNKLLKLAIISKNKNTDIIRCIKEKMPKNKYLSDDWGIESLIWATIPKNGEINLLDSWVEMVSSLNKEQYLKAKKVVNVFFDFEEMYKYYIDKTWINLKNNIPNDINKIKKLISINQRLVQFGKRVDDDYITAISIRNIVIFKCEYLKDNYGFEYGIAEVANIKNKKSRFIITSMIGKQYYYLKRYDQAKLWLEKVLEFEKINGEIGEKIWALLELSNIYEKINIQKSYNYAKETLKLIPKLDNDNIIRFYMEYLIRCFYLDKFEENIPICLECTKIILKNSEKKGLIAFFTHIIGYFVSYIVENIRLDEVNKEYSKPYTQMTIYANKMDDDKNTNQKIKTIYMYILKLLVFYKKKKDIVEFFIQIYSELKKNGMGITIFFPNEIRIFLIENNYIQESIQLLKIMNIFSNNIKKLLPNDPKQNPLELTERIEKIYENDKKITQEEMSEVFIFCTIFKLMNKDMQIVEIETLREFQQLDEKIKNEYLDIIRIIKKEKKVTKEQVYYFISEKERDKNITFEIIYRLLLLDLLKGKKLINYQINLLIYFSKKYGTYSTEETLLKWCILLLENDIKENNNYIQTEILKEKIDLYKQKPNITNAKEIYIEALKNLGFDEIFDENLNWLKENDKN